MIKKRIKLNLNNVTLGMLKRIEVALEKNLSKDSYVFNVNESTVIINNSLDLDKTINIIKSVDNSITIKSEEVKEKYRYVFYLENLDCANCALKVERICRRSIPNELVVVDFATLKIIIETTKKYDLFELRMLIQEHAETVDPLIEVKEKAPTKKEEKQFRIDPKKKKEFLIGFSIFLIFYIAKNVLKFIFNIESGWISVMIYIGYIPSYFLLAKEVLNGALSNMKSGRIFDEKFLMALATVMALLTGLYDEALIVIIFYRIGELCQQYAVNYSRKSIASLVDIKPATATIDIDGKKHTISPEGVVVGDILYVNSGERIALDGDVIEGEAMLDLQALTGESRPVEVSVNDSVLSGSICIDGTIKIKVSKTSEESMVSKIIDVAMNASSLKAKSEDFISKFAKYYTPLIVFLAVVIAIFLPIFGSNYVLGWKGGFQDSLRVSMIFLVVSCPCALVISIPLGFFGGIGACSREGILVKGSNYLETLNQVGVVVFDKTGTLTKGNFALKEVVSISSYTKEEILHYAAFAEATSSHVIAKSIVSAYGSEIDTTVVTKENIDDKRGIVCTVEGKVISIGRSSFIENLKIKIPNEVEKDALIISINNVVCGYLILEDEVRDEAFGVIKKLRKQGVDKIIILTGDSYSVCDKVCKLLNIDEFYSDMSPIDKVNTLQEIKKKYPTKRVCYVGDGINDAPVLSSSDVGIAMGGFGSEAATQIADVVLLQDDLTKINTSIKIAKKTKAIVIENIILALSVKLLFLIISPFNISEIFNTFLVYAAIFADVGVSLIAILNALKILKVKSVK